ncbi:MAG: hypothetical protein AB1468_02130 [Candidatus Micrarchaeota archaeon]
MEKNIEYVEREVGAITSELEREIKKLKDPTVHAGIMYSVVRERETTNALLREINAKLEKLHSLEERVRKLEESVVRAPKKEIMLAEVDEEILKFVRGRGRACAEDVQRAFNYRGRNAASARLNKLFENGVLEKRQAGRKVYYIAKTS